VGVDREGNEITLIDLVSTEADTVIHGVEQNILMERLLDITKNILEKREYEIIVKRYGLGGTASLTQREVADMFKISRSYVSRIEKRAIDKIRENIKKEDLYF
jgi:RNA polymerase sporulation-specific sigma factor